MAMDISSDDTLLVTASSDKNVKIWGLDFGDCHKSMFAHTDAIMSVCFVPRTHYFFSASKDGVIKMFDGEYQRVCFGWLYWLLVCGLVVLVLVVLVWVVCICVVCNLNYLYCVGCT
jgi:WD40 repeat protein